MQRSYVFQKVAEDLCKINVTELWVQKYKDKGYMGQFKITDKLCINLADNYVVESVGWVIQGGNEIWSVVVLTI